MPTISRFYGMLIIMFYREGFNEKPHFHVRYNEFDAKFSIADFSLIKGKLPTHALTLIKEWAGLHQQELLDNWERIKNSEPLKKIDPLV
jgi:hypothetical protein